MLERHLAATTAWGSLRIVLNPERGTNKCERLKQYGLVPCTPTNGSEDAPDYDLAYLPRSAPMDIHDLILGKPIC